MELPQDAQAIVSLLKSMGVREYEPRVVQQLTDFAYRYTSDVLQEAQAIAERAGAPRGQIGLPDLLLATQTRNPHAFVPPPPQRALRSLAHRTNSKPLPPPRERSFGIKLPPEADCLTAPNWQVLPSAQSQAREAARAQQQQRARAGGTQQQQQQQQQQEGGGSYGVRREQRIGMAVPGQGWQPPVPDAAAPAPEPFPQQAAVAAAAATGGPSPMQLDGQQQQHWGEEDI